MKPNGAEGASRETCGSSRPRRDREARRLRALAKALAVFRNQRLRARLLRVHVSLSGGTGEGWRSMGGRGRLQAFWRSSGCVGRARRGLARGRLRFGLSCGLNPHQPVGPKALPDRRLRRPPSPIRSQSPNRARSGADPPRVQAKYTSSRRGRRRIRSGAIIPNCRTSFLAARRTIRWERGRSRSTATRSRSTARPGPCAPRSARRRRTAASAC